MPKENVKGIIGGIVILLGGMLIVIGLINIYLRAGCQWGIFSSLIVIGLLIIVFTLFFLLKNNPPRTKEKN